MTSYLGLKWVGNLPAEKLEHFEITNGVVGLPEATPGYTSAELQKLGLIGIYKAPGTTEECTVMRRGAHSSHLRP